MNAFIIYNQMQLASYLTTINVEYTLDNSMAFMDALFERMFVLEQEEVIEQRKRPLCDDRGNVIRDAEGNVLMELYDCHIWKIMLTSTGIEEIITELLNEAEISQWETYCESEGGLQIFGSPFAFDWTGNVSSYYGYRNHPIEGKKKIA